MLITELKEQIMKNTLGNFYIFVGEEIGIINIYLNQMSNKIGLPITRADSVLSIYSSCTTRSLFGNKTGFYVIRDDYDVTKQEGLYETIADDIGKNVIVLLYDKVDSRLKFFKHFKDQIVIFEKLTPMVLTKYIQKEGFIESSAKKLAELVNGSYDLAMLECDKINQYADSKNIANLQAFDELLEQGVIYQPVEYDVFKFTDAVMSGNVMAFDIARNLLDNGNSSINLLGTLYNSVKSVMLIQCCNGHDICNITGLDNRQVYFNKKYCDVYTIQHLVAMAKLIIQVVSDVKSGKIDDRYATQYVLCQML